jgi:hypothetical protein
MDLGEEHQSLRVHEQMTLRVPLTFLAPSYPRSSPPTPVVFTDWLSTIPALGWGFLRRRTLTRFSRAECILSHSPLRRQALK